MNTENLWHSEVSGCSKGELAQAYFPRTIDPKNALRNLARWIDMNPELVKQLKESGYQRRQRLLTPRQVSIIYKFLGEP